MEHPAAPPTPSPEMPPLPHARPRSFGQTVGLAMGAQALLLLTSVVASVVAARFLGPAGRGQLAALTTLAMILVTLADVGLSSATIHFLAQNRFTWKDALVTVLVPYGGICLLLLPAVAVIIATAGAQLFPGVPFGVLLLAVVLIPLGLLQTHLGALLIGSQLAPEASVMKIVERGGTMLALVAFVLLLRLNVSGALVAQCLGGLAALAAAVMVLRRRASAPFHVRWTLLPELFRFGRQCYAAVVATLLNSRLDVLLVFWLCGKRETGLYAIAYGIAEMTQNLPSAISPVLFAAISEQPHEQTDKTRLLSQGMTLVLTIIGLLAIGVGYPLLGMLYGPAFLPAYGALVCLAPGMVFLAQGKVVLSDLVGRGYPRYYATAAWLGVALTLAGNLLLIPRWGIIGAATASSIAYTLTALVLASCYARVTGETMSSLYFMSPDTRQRLLQWVLTSLTKKRPRAETPQP